MKIGKKKMLNVRLAGDQLHGKLLFTWLSLVMSMMCLCVLSFFPRDVLDEIWDLVESVSEGFPTYSFKFHMEHVLTPGSQNCKIVSDQET